jgi:subtilisin family serine protease
MFNKKLFFCFFVLSLYFFSNSNALAFQSRPIVELDNGIVSQKKLDRPKYVPDEVLVKFKEDRVNLANSGLISFFREFSTSFGNNLEKSDVLESGNIVIYKIKDGRSVEEVINELKNDSNVELVEPNYYSYVSSLGTNDTEKNNLWGLDNTGQTITFDSGATTVGTAGVDIGMSRAWGVSTGTSDVIVAVIDTGVDYNHPDLIDNMWNGSNCKDENGDLISGGCLHGYNFVSNSNDPAPVNSQSESLHGTHVAGTIAASVNNGLGVVGVGGYKVKIMALNCQDIDGSINSGCIIKSIDFAIQNGAKVINASYGGSYFSQLEYDAINRFRTAGGIFVAAAGNESNNNDSTGHSYPSDYDLDNIISVAATDNKDGLASFSNYGVNSVDVGAPGVSILSTVPYKKDYNEDFSNLTPELGSSWLPDTRPGRTKLLWTDMNSPYLNNSDYTITSSVINLAGDVNNLTKFNLNGQCNDAGNTNPDNSAVSDYMALEVSGDGTNFAEVSRWNELSLSVLPNSSCSLGTCVAPLSFTIDNSYLTSNFKYRFRWVTDASGATDDGCVVSSVNIIDYPANGEGAGYDYLQGTSMAAPHVAGLAGYLLSVSPTSTYSQIISNILTNGDSISSLAGKTTTGKRINAFNSVSALDITPVDPSPTPTITETPSPTPTGPSPTPTGPEPTPTPTGPTTTPVRIGATDISTLITNGTFNVGTSEITVTNDVYISVGEGSTAAVINLAKDTKIVREDGENIDASLISAINMDKNEVSNLTTGFTPQSLLQWGIPGVTLTFSTPVQMDIYLGSDFNDQTLTILRSSDISSGWTSDGLVSTTCVVTNGVCNFSTNKASYFTVVSYQALVVNQPSNNQSSNNNSSSNNSSPGSGAQACTDVPPTDNPDLFEFKANKGKTKLIYTPSSKATAYAVLYGLKKGDERFGAIVGTVNNNQGVQNADIFALNSKTTYYFKVAAINGCTISPWSDWVPVKADRTRTVYKYKTIILKGIKMLINQYLK